MYSLNIYRRFILSITLFLTLTLLGVVFTGETQENTPITALPENLQVITADNFDQLQLLGTIRDRYVAAPIIVWSSDNRQFVALTPDGFYLVHTNDLMNGQFLIYANNYFRGADFAYNDPFRLAIAGEEAIYIVDSRTYDLISEIATDYPAGKVLFSPNGRFIVAEDSELGPDKPNARHPGEVTIYEVESGEMVGRVGYPYSSSILDNPDPVPFAFSMDGTQLLTGRDGLHAWNYTNTQDYRDPNLMSKAEYLDIITNIRMQIEDSPTFSWAGYANSDGLYALWLTSEGSKTYFSIQDGGFEVVVPGETGEGHDENGIPATVGDFTQLERRDLVRGLQILSETPFETPSGSTFITRMGEAALLANLYAYDAETDTLTNQETGLVYAPTLVFGAGRYEDNAGQPISLSGGGYFNRYFEVEEGRLPDVVMDNLLVQEIAFSQDRSMMVVSTINRESGDHEIHLMDTERNQTQLDIPEDIIIYAFSFNANGNLLIATDAANPGIIVWDLNTFDIIRNQAYEGNERLAPQHTFSPDGRILVRHGQEIQFWGIPN